MRLPTGQAGEGCAWKPKRLASLSTASKTSSSVILLASRAREEPLTPVEKDRALVNRVIFDELCLGDICNDSRAEFLRTIDGLAEREAQGVVLGCTEIGLLVRPEDTDAPLFDTTLIHARGAALRALED